MSFSAIITLFIINAVDLGIKFGPALPSGSLEDNYKPTTALSGFCLVSNFIIDYNYSQFRGKINGQENLLLHTITVSYEYPFYEKNNHWLNFSIGGNYNYIQRKMLSAREQTYAMGLKYGAGYKYNFPGTAPDLISRLKPAAHTNLYLNQTIQTRDWNYNQIMSSNFFFSVMLGISIKIL